MDGAEDPQPARDPGRAAGHRQDGHQHHHCRRGRRGVPAGADGSWQTGSDGSLTFGGLDAERTYTICARYAAVTSGDSPTFVSRETCIQAATKAAPGQAPVVSGVIVTDTTVTLPENAAWEYSTDGETWDSTHEFTGLDPATQYTYYVRERETDGAEASEIATVTVCTAYSAPADGEGYAIDYERRPSPSKAAMRSTRRRTSPARRSPAEVPWPAAPDRPSISAARRTMAAPRPARRCLSPSPPVPPHPA